MNNKISKIKRKLSTAFTLIIRIQTKETLLIFCATNQLAIVMNFCGLSQDNWRSRAKSATNWGVDPFLTDKNIIFFFNSIDFDLKTQKRKHFVAPTDTPIAERTVRLPIGRQVFGQRTGRSYTTDPTLGQRCQGCRSRPTLEPTRGWNTFAQT